MLWGSDSPFEMFDRSKIYDWSVMRFYSLMQFPEHPAYELYREGLQNVLTMIVRQKEEAKEEIAKRKKRLAEEQKRREEEEKAVEVSED